MLLLCLVSMLVRALLLVCLRFVLTYGDDNGCGCVMMVML